MKSLSMARLAAASALLAAAGLTHAVTLVMNVGTLPGNSSNNEFLFTFQANADGTYRPSNYFYSVATNTVFGTSTTNYTQGDNQLFTFDYQFSVAAPSTLFQNTFYSTLINVAGSSLTLLNGSTVIATGTPTTPSGTGYNYTFPATTLAASTTYTLRLTGRSPATTFTGSSGFAQIPLDVSSVPEPATGWMLAAGIGLLATARKARPSAGRSAQQA